jgi:ribonuclease VapC
MIIDTSAIIAILRDEAGASDCALAIEKTRSRRMSAANFVESALVIDGSRDPIASRRLNSLRKPTSVLSPSAWNRPASPVRPIAISVRGVDTLQN